VICWISKERDYQCPDGSDVDGCGPRDKLKHIEVELGVRTSMAEHHVKHGPGDYG
jgi:hypothetical protein